jgi:hypothetical protein
MKQQHQLVGKLLCMLLPFCVACSDGGDDGDDAPAPTNEWNGKTYLVELITRNWTQPTDVVLDFAPYVRGFLFSVSGTSSDDYNVTLGTLTLNADDTDPPPAPAQDMCNPTGTLKGSGNVIGPSDVKLNIRHLGEGTNLNVYATARKFTLTNVLPTGGVASTAGKFQATLDAREIYPLFTALDETPTAELLCQELAELAHPAPCEPCPHDNQPWCLTLIAETPPLGAAESSIVLQPVSDDASRAASCMGGLNP